MPSGADGDLLGDLPRMLVVELIMMNVGRGGKAA